MEQQRYFLITIVTLASCISMLLWSTSLFPIEAKEVNLLIPWHAEETIKSERISEGIIISNGTQEYFCVDKIVINGKTIKTTIKYLK